MDYFRPPVRSFTVSQLGGAKRTKEVFQAAWHGCFQNNGTPKSSILIRFSIILTIHFGGLGKKHYFWKDPHLGFWRFSSMRLNQVNDVNVSSISLEDGKGTGMLETRQFFSRCIKKCPGPFCTSPLSEAGLAGNVGIDCARWVKDSCLKFGGILGHVVRDLHHFVSISRFNERFLVKDGLW